MAVIVVAAREIHAKIVYYGPGLSGKTTNLAWIYDHLPMAERSELVSINTEQERTLFFDFLPLDASPVGDYRLRLHLYSVPGQERFGATRSAILRGVDGIVFVADSQYDKMQENVESFQNLEDNLRTLNLNLADIPYVLQYNKRDMDCLAPVDFLDFLLNNKETEVPAFEASATKVDGVFETLNGITRLLLQKFIAQGTQS